MAKTVYLQVCDIKPRPDGVCLYTAATSKGGLFHALAEEGEFAIDDIITTAWEAVEVDDLASRVWIMSIESGPEKGLGFVIAKNLWTGTTYALTVSEENLKHLVVGGLMHTDDYEDYHIIPKGAAIGTMMIKASYGLEGINHAAFKGNSIEELYAKTCSVLMFEDDRNLCRLKIEGGSTQKAFLGYLGNGLDWLQSLAEAEFGVGGEE